MTVDPTLLWPLVTLRQYTGSAVRGGYAKHNATIGAIVDTAVMIGVILDHAGVVDLDLRATVQVAWDDAPRRQSPAAHHAWIHMFNTVLTAAIEEQQRRGA